MTRFVGLDVSQKMTAICVVDHAGRRLWRGQCPTIPEQISILVRRHAGEDARIGIETGAMTPWLVHELRNLGLEVVCLDARQARTALKMQINKTDQNDAEGLAQIVRTGWYRAVHVKSFDGRRARALLGARTQLIGMTTRLSNHIRGVLKTFGLLPGAMRGLPFDRKVEALVKDHDPTLAQQILDIPEAWGEPDVTPDRLLDNFRSEAVAAIADLGHRRWLRLKSPKGKPTGDGTRPFNAMVNRAAAVMALK